MSTSSPTPASELTYVEATQELDQIIGQLDQGLVDLDELDIAFQRAVEIVEELDRRIKGARERVDALLPRLAALGDLESVEE
jgi:exodeoxyribonuclease VII small subunit